MEEQYETRQQESYETRRRSRMLGLSIDQLITGCKNIASYGNPNLWPQEQREQWEHVVKEAQILLLEAQSLERELKELANIYESMVVRNQE